MSKNVTWRCVFFASLSVFVVSRYYVKHGLVRVLPKGSTWWSTVSKDLMFNCHSSQIHNFEHILSQAVRNSTTTGYLAVDINCTTTRTNYLKATSIVEKLCCADKWLDVWTIIFQLRMLFMFDSISSAVLKKQVKI